MNALPVPVDSLDAYLAEVNRFPVLSREEEHRLAVDYHENGTLESAHRLVTANLRFVFKIANEYRAYGVAMKDLVQEGNLGLMTAVKKFNPYKGWRLITYAVWWIKAFIQEHILKSRGVVKRGSRELKKRLFYRHDATGGDAGSGAIAALPVDFDVAAVDLSLDAPIGDGDGKTHLDALVDPAPMHSDMTAEREARAETTAVVAEALATLTERERFVVERRFLVEAPESLQQIGDALGLTRERVRQIEKGTLKKLKSLLSTQTALPAGA